jgi:sugar/nucleoside kinase (ribokinase family)
MSLLVVGSVALDSVQTPFGSVTDALGGSAVFFSAAASLLSPVRVVGVVGDDYPLQALHAIRPGVIDWSGVEQAEGESFRWSGKYSYDLGSRDTLETRLGVFADFSPSLPPAFASSPYVFLGNIDPVLQLQVLSQVASPKLVACDTMNFWISSKKADVLEVLRRVDLLMLNDSELRELTGDWNVHRAGRWVLAQGPRRVVVKRGEFGALLIEAGHTFFVPAYPLEEVFDPTGAGDAFAGGFFGYVARTGDISNSGLRRAMVYGSVMGSFAVSGFGVDGFRGVTPETLRQRLLEFHGLTHVDLAEAIE